MLKYTNRYSLAAWNFRASAQRLANCRMSSASSTSANSEEKQPKTPFEVKLAEAKEKLKWRTPYNERDNEWYTKFKVFAPEKNEDVDMITYLQTPFDLTLKGRRKRIERKRVALEKAMQQFVPDRHKILGNDLAAAHFLVHRGGSVKFVNKPKWIKRSEDLDYTTQMPDRFDPSWSVEAIRCDDMELYYEGLDNVRRLERLKFLSFHNVKTFDDWCLDRVSGSEFSSLEVLDISGTQVTERGLCALYRIPTLRVLIVDDPQVNKTYELTCALLEEFNPEIKITQAQEVH